MDKSKRIKKVIFLVVLICLALGSSCILMLKLFILPLVFPYSEIFPYWNTTKIKSREEMFQFVIEHQEELEQIVKDMEEASDVNEDDVILIYRDNVLQLDEERVKINSVSKMFKAFSIYRVAIAVYASEENFKVNFSFAYVPTGYDYWGIYYKSDDTVHFWDAGGEVHEENGVYTQIGSYYKYETEKIIDNWYYYQCNTR